MIRVGVRAHDYGRDAPDRLFGRIAADGFDCVQLAFQKAVAGVADLRGLGPETVEEAAAALDKNGLWTAVFGAYVDLALPDPAARRENAAQVVRCLPYAKRLGAGCIGMETTAGAKQAGMTRREALEAFLRSVGEILPEAERLGVTVAIEPVLTHTVDTPERAAEVLKTLASPSLGVIFDPVNLLSAGAVPKQRELWDRALDCFGDRIASVHFKGIAPNGAGALQKTDLEHSAVDYPYLFRLVKRLPQDLSALREEADPASAARDCAFLRAGLA